MRTTRGNRNINWIECYSRDPDRGAPVRLSDAERVVLRKLYDAPGGPRDDVAVPKPLSIYVALLHLCGPEALQEKFRPAIEVVDAWSIWRATSGELQAALKRHKGHIVCPEFGTQYPAAA